MTKYSKLSGEKIHFFLPPQDSLSFLPPWGTAPAMESQDGFWGTRLQALPPPGYRTVSFQASALSCLQYGSV